MNVPEILGELVGREVIVQLAGGGVLEGKLLQLDALGGMFEIADLSHPALAGPIAAWASEERASEESTLANAYIPLAQIVMLIPAPAEQ